MKFTFTLSLERRALIKIVTQLFNERTVHKQFSGVEEPEWNAIRRKIIINVEKLEISSSLKFKIIQLIKPISREIASWRDYHVGNKVENPLKVPHAFFWTPQGTIDIRRTAVSLVRREDIDVNHRYLWACYYSLGPDIHVLWNKLNKNGYLTRKIVTNVVATYWSSRMDNTLKWLTSHITIKRDIDALRRLPEAFVLDYLCYKLGANASSFSGIPELFYPESHKTVAAAEYFWQLLAPHEKTRFASKYHVQPQKQSGDMIYFAFSKLDEQNQLRVLMSSHTYILLSFLIWPRHCFFLEVAKRCADFFSRTSFYHVLRRILKGAKQKIEGYSELVEEFWNLGPDKCQKYVIQRINKNLFDDFCAIKDRKVILSIFGSVYNKGNEQMLLPQGMLICKLMILSNCLGLFEDFLVNLLPSIKSIVEFKEKFEKILTTPSNTAEIEGEQLQRARAVLDSALAKRKRQAECISEHNVATKRRRIEQ